MLPAPKLSTFKKLQVWLPTIILSILFVALITNLVWPTNNLEQAIRKAQRWPQLPPVHFFLARLLSQNGYEQLAKKEFSLGEKQLNQFPWVWMVSLFQNDQQIAQTTVYEKTSLQNQIGQLDQLLAKYPYSWPLIFQKAVLFYRLYDDGRAQENLELAWWLNPGNKTISEVAGLLEK